VVWLAERFRFDRARRFWGVLPHVPACLAIALACQGISMLLTQRERGFVFHTGSFEFARDGAGVVRGLSLNTNSSPDAPRLPRVIMKSTNRSIDQAAGGPGLRVGQTLSIRVIDIPSGTPAPGALQIASAKAFIGDLPPPLTLAIPGPWTRFFQLAFARAQSTIPIYWAIACVTWLISYYQQLRERERRTLELEARLMQANLQTLKTQLQPHFLFNTLNAIASLVRRKPDVAEDMIGSLSDFLRMSLDTAHQHEVPLRREIEFLDLYLEIQQTRFGERLRIQKEIDPAALDVAVPTLILQPLVENSIRHGIEPRETGGTILVRSLHRESSLRLEIRDDGEGLKAGQLAALRDGVGLSNTKARLQELYGDGHRFQITPNAEGGLTVAVELPWRETPSKQA
jgi:two-component sensor histidine kinase